MSSWLSVVESIATVALEHCCRRSRLSKWLLIVAVYLPFSSPKPVDSQSSRFPLGVPRLLDPGRWWFWQSLSLIGWLLKRVIFSLLLVSNHVCLIGLQPDEDAFPQFPIVNMVVDLCSNLDSVKLSIGLYARLASMLCIKLDMSLKTTRNLSGPPC